MAIAWCTYQSTPFIRTSVAVNDLLGLPVDTLSQKHEPYSRMIGWGLWISGEYYYGSCFDRKAPSHTDIVDSFIRNWLGGLQVKVPGKRK